MTQNSHSDRAISEALDACRPARLDPEGHDWQQPEIAALAEQIAGQAQYAEQRERIEAIDSAVAATIVQAPVPAGLADRLLVALRSAAPMQAGEPASGAVDSPEPTTPSASALTLAPEDKRWRLAGRRTWLVGAATLAVAACVAGIWAVFGSSQPLSYEQVIAEAKSFDASLPAEGWKLPEESQPDPWYSISSSISATRAGWQYVNKFLKRDGVAYQLLSRSRAKAVLYVVPLDKVGRPVLEVVGAALPNRPDTTGGKATAAWTDGKRLFVLVVEGGQREYESFRRPIPIA
ncbi:MAG TPA: hypothetical protein VHB99_16810 [Pirellulales bacterium]|nr:hypothetical protein [Pirellulales bacterium]